MDDMASGGNQLGTIYYIRNTPNNNVSSEGWIDCSIMQAKQRNDPFHRFSRKWTNSNTEDTNVDVIKMEF